MDTYETISGEPSGPQEGGATIALFLGLYLLVLAFFIVLVSISTVEDVKSRAVMDSLTSTFATLLPPNTDLTPFVAKDGDVLAGYEFQREITGIFATALKVAKVEIVRPGELMRVAFATDALFFKDEARIRPARYPLLDRLVASLSTRPRGLRYDVEFIVGGPAMGDDTAGAERALAMSQAGTFARTLLGRGAPPDCLSVGLMPGKQGEAVFLFHVRPRGEKSIGVGDGVSGPQDRGMAGDG